MTEILILIPYLISIFIGCGILGLLLPAASRSSLALFIFLGAGVGLALSASLTFINFIIFHHYSAAALVIEHLVISLGLLFFYGKTIFSLSEKKFLPALNPQACLPFILLLILMLPLWFDAHFYPDGGWDAWSTWNFKAKFLFLSGDQWKNLFEPILWRSSPHYPLFLPCLSIWGWTFLGQADSAGPMIVALIFSYLTAGLILSSLRSYTRNLWFVIVPLLLFSVPFAGKLAISQYSDIAVGYYLLAIFVTLQEYLRSQHKNYLILTGLLLGFLAFTKQEGTLATMILAAGVPVLLWINRPKNGREFFKMLGIFFGALALAAIPFVLFQKLCSPGNQTFINGLTSSTAPATPERFKFMFAFLGMELVSAKWNGLWIFVVFAAIVAGRRLFQKEMLAIPVFLVLYLAVIFAYYFVNTRWEIGWWMQVSLHRILFTLLPTIVFWIFRPTKN